MHSESVKYTYWATVRVISDQFQVLIQKDDIGEDEQMSYERTKGAFGLGFATVTIIYALHHCVKRSKQTAEEEDEGFHRI